MDKEYCVCIGISLEEIINFFPYFDILETNFLYYINEFLSDISLDDENFNKLLFDKFKSVRHLKYWKGLTIKNNGKYIKYDIDDHSILYLEIGIIDQEQETIIINWKKTYD